MNLLFISWEYYTDVHFKIAWRLAFGCVPAADGNGARSLVGGATSNGGAVKQNWETILSYWQQCRSCHQNPWAIDNKRRWRNCSGLMVDTWWKRIITTDSPGEEALSETRENGGNAVVSLSERPEGLVNSILFCFVLFLFFRPHSDSKPKTLSLGFVTACLLPNTSPPPVAPPQHLTFACRTSQTH